jgi:hypothetical protein
LAINTYIKIPLQCLSKYSKISIFGMKKIPSGNPAAVAADDEEKKTYCAGFQKNCVQTASSE